MNDAQKDFTDLQDATNAYRESCKELDKYLKEELKATVGYNEKISEVSIKHWEDLQLNLLTSAKYRDIIKHETALEKIALEAAKLQRKIAENRNDSLRENLYTIKKCMNY